MNRVLKFRAWVPEIKTMLHDIAIYPESGLIGMSDDSLMAQLPNGYEFNGEYIIKPDEDGGYEETLNILGCEGDWINIEGATIMQFTGLCDKNGKEIYEGDVLQCGGIGVVEYVDNGFHIKSPGSRAVDYVSRYLFNHSEIIGNIYEDSELI